MHRLFSRLVPPKGRREAGATLVEYSLIVALLVVTSIGVLDFLTERANDQVNNQADCVSTRPPPPECQAPPVPTSDPNPVPTTEPTVPPLPVEAFIDAIELEDLDGVVTAQVAVRIADLGGEPAAGAQVYLSFYCPGVSTPFIVPAQVTSSSGNTIFNVPMPCTGNVTFHVYQVFTNNGAAVTTISTVVSVTTSTP